jgi:transposase InsO family protein
MTTPYKEWFGTSELASLNLPCIPATKRGINALAKRENWSNRPRKAQGGGVEYHISNLPSTAQTRLISLLKPVDTNTPTLKSAGSAKARWEHYEAQSDKRKAKAKYRLDILQKVEILRLNGVPVDVAAMQIAKAHKVSLRSIHGWRARVAGIEKVNWLPYLADGYTGRIVQAELHPDAYDMIKSDYLRVEKPNFTDCYDRARMAAHGRGWTLPSERTVLRRIQSEVHPAVIVMCREGMDAAWQMFPAQERDRSGFVAMEAVNVDGHKWDVFVKFPDGEIVRPMMVGFQDLYSGKLLSWRIDKSENTWAVRLAFGDMIENFGIPKGCYFDNGRAFASKWLTGGVKNRFRFKVKDDEPLGIMTQMGVEIHWTTPYAGQSKPVERLWRDYAQSIARHPAFAGAWAGNNIDAKPENYQSKAIPFAEFERIVASEIARFNAKPGRNTKVCRNVLSYDEAFNASIEQHGITKCPAEARRLWMLAAEGITVNGKDGVVRLMKNRYWAEFLHLYRGEKIVARFDPDYLHDGLHIYKLDGAYLGFADVIEAVGFADADAAREHARARRKWLNGVKQIRDAEKVMSASQVASMVPTFTGTEPPSSKVIKLAHPVHDLKRRPSAPELTDADKAKRARLTAEIAEFPNRKTETTEQDRKRERFAKAQAIQHALEHGGEVGDGDAAWLARYQTTPEYKAQASIAEDFGSHGTA